MEMLERPPDVLVIQTHVTLIERDIDIIEQLSRRFQALGFGHGRDRQGRAADRVSSPRQSAVATTRDSRALPPQGRAVPGDSQPAVAA